MLPLSSLLLTLASLQSEVMEAPAKPRPETDVEQESVTDRSIEGGEVTKRTLQSELADTALKPRERAVHLLSRLSYHPTPADLAEVERIGIVNWVDRQLQPGRMENARFQHRISELNGINMAPGEAFAWAQDGAREAGQLDLFYKAGESVDLAELTELEREQIREQREVAQGEYRKRIYQLQFEFLGATLARAVESDRQGEEVLADFWRNHFNIDARKGGREAAFWMPEWEQQVLREHLWGSFEAMLVATAKHPAMLNYLDQAQSRRRYSEEEIERFRKRQERRGTSPERIEETLRRQASGGRGQPAGLLPARSNPAATCTGGRVTHSTVDSIVILQYLDLDLL